MRDNGRGNTMQTAPLNIRNILLVRNDRFGEFLLNIPALRAIRETFPQAKITIAVDPYVRELAECLPYIDEVVQWSMLRHSLTERFGFIKTLRSKAIDMAIMLNPTKEFNIFTYILGVPVRVGYDRKWGFLLTHKIKDIKYLGRKHEVEYNLELVGLIGAGTPDKSLSLSLEAGNAADDLLSGSDIKDDNILIALHPWTSDPIKEWPLNNFYELTLRLIGELKARIVVVGGKEELVTARELFKGFDQRLIDVTGKTTLKELAALLKKCRVLISPDSGPVHLSCAVGTPVIVIFRNDIPAKCAKRWGPWGKGNFVIEKSRLSDITVDEVFDKVKEALKT